MSNLNQEQGDSSLITKLFAHHRWANLKLLNFCERLTDEQLDSAVVGGFGSIRSTLPHIFGAEISYVTRVNGKRPPQPLVRGEFPTFALMKEVAQWTGNELLQLALTARTESMVQESFPEDGVIDEYPLTTLLTQAISHATEHRSQIATIITQLGLEPPDMSVWAYMVEMGDFRQSKIGQEATDL